MTSYQLWPTTDLCKSCKLWLLKQHCFDKPVYPLIEIIYLAIDQPSEEASASHPACILWAIVHCNLNEPRPGIYMVRVRLLPGVWLPLVSYEKVIYNEVVIGLTRSRAMVRARRSVRMRVLVVFYTLSMYFLLDQYPRRIYNKPYTTLLRIHCSECGLACTVTSCPCICMLLLCSDMS